MTAFESELGVQAPVGFWDPVGFTSDGDDAAFKRRRSVELKHGRISMMAAMGGLDAFRGCKVVLHLHTQDTLDSMLSPDLIKVPREFSRAILVSSNVPHSFEFACLDDLYACL